MHWPMDRGVRYEAIALIGEGSFGRVFKARHVSSNTIVALKVISKVNRTEEELQMLRTEFKIQTQLDHINIVKMIDSYETETELVAVTEYLPNELHRVFGQHRQRLSESRVQSLALDLFNALFYLHSHRILHRDLKPQNVLLSNEGVAKVCDFGFARILSSKTLVLTSIKGTPLYMAPEIIEEQPYDQKADLWSIGCILYELAVGKPPFNTKSLFELINKVREEEIKWPSHLSQPCKSFLQGLLEKDPRARFSWSQVLSHEFLRGSVQNVQTNIETMQLCSSLRRSSLTEPLTASQELEKELQRQQKRQRPRSGTLVQMAKKHDEDRKQRDAQIRNATIDTKSESDPSLKSKGSNLGAEPSVKAPVKSKRAVFDVVDANNETEAELEEEQEDWICLMNFLQGDQSSAIELLSNSNVLKGLLRRVLYCIKGVLVNNDNEEDEKKVENALTCLMLPFVAHNEAEGGLQVTLKAYQDAQVLGSLLRVCELIFMANECCGSITSKLNNLALLTTSLISRLLYNANESSFSHQLEENLLDHEDLLLRFLNSDQREELITWLCHLAHHRRESRLFSGVFMDQIRATRPTSHIGSDSTDLLLRLVERS